MLQIPIEIEYAITCLSWACSTFVCIFFFRRRVYRLAPEFTNFIVYNTVISWVLYAYLFTSQIYHPRSLGYYYWWWTAEFISEAIEVLTIYALFARVLRVLPESRQKSRSLPLVSILFLLIVVLGNFAQSEWSAWTITKRLEFIRENLVLVECGLVFAVILFSLVVAVSLKAPIKGILAGFAVDSSVRLIIYAIGIFHYPKPAMVWPLGRLLATVAESLGVYIWLAVMLRTPRDSSQDPIAYRRDLESYRFDLEGWISRVGEMVYRLPNTIRAMAHLCLLILRHR